MRYDLVIRRATLALLAGAVPASGQRMGDSLAKRTVDWELVSPAGLGAWNYQQVVARQTFVRAAVAHWSVKGFLMDDRHSRGTLALLGTSHVFDLSRLPGLRGVWIETGASVAAGKRSWEGGLGGNDESGPWLALNTEAGIRLQDPGRGMTYRVLIGPAWVFRSSLEDIPPGFRKVGAGTISLGYAF